MLKFHGRGSLCGRLAACTAWVISPLFLVLLPPKACARADDAPVSNNRPLHAASRIAAAVRDLGSDDFDTREQAGNFLWSLGEQAAPALA